MGFFSVFFFKNVFPVAVAVALLCFLKTFWPFTFDWYVVHNHWTAEWSCPYGSWLSSNPLWVSCNQPTIPSYFLFEYWFMFYALFFFIATLISIAQWYTVFFIVISTFHSSESHNFYYGYPSTAPEYPLQLISIAPQPPAFHNCVIFQDCRLLVENLTVLFAAVIKKICFIRP